MAAVHRTDEDLESLQQAVEANRAYRDQGEWKEFFDSDTQFHLAIAAATQNPFLPVMLEPLLGLIMTARESYYEKGLMGRLLPRDVAEVQHNRIIAAIVSQEPEEAGRAMEEHLSTFIRNVEAHERSRRSRPGDPSL
jgi:GntR family transcriptional repressor for pyruvate dehydrogenase complex